MFILVYEANIYYSLVQRNYFLKQLPIASLKNCVLQKCNNFAGGDAYGIMISKKVTWHICMLYCKFDGDLQNTILEEHLWRLLLGVISFVLVQVINNTFYWLAIIIYRPEFVDWSETLTDQNNLPNACCNWSTYYFFISIFTQ